MTVVVVRPATVDDADDIGRVHVRAWQAAYRGLIDDDHLDGLSVPARQAQWRQRLLAGLDSTVLVAEDPTDGHVCGWVAVGEVRPPVVDGLPDGTGELWAINLEPEAWGRGIGAALLAAGTDELARQSNRHAVLWVLEGNARARRFYEREGWAFDGATKVDDREGLALHELRYRRRLPPRRSE